MKSRNARTKAPAGFRGPAPPAFRGERQWKLEDAKARFSEVVRRAQDEGPQRVTVRGVDAVMVVAIDDWRKHTARPRKEHLVDALRRTALGEIDITRDSDRGRDIDL